MKQLLKTSTYRSAFTLIMLALFQVMAFAQDSTGSSSSSSKSTTSSTTTTTDQTWYTQPWVWIVGGAVLILLIIALVRGNSGTTTGRSDSVTVKKTVSRDTDTV